MDKDKGKNSLNNSDRNRILDFSFDDIWDAEKQVPKLNSKEILEILSRNIDNIRFITLKLAVAINTLCDSIEILGEILENE